MERRRQGQVESARLGRLIEIAHRDHWQAPGHAGAFQAPGEHSRFFSIRARVDNRRFDLQIGRQPSRSSPSDKGPAMASSLATISTRAWIDKEAVLRLDVAAPFPISVLGDNLGQDSALAA
jgi:hypothetical protein